ncbi:hypothetical protein KOW79_009893 [Hemibagrus wyckioides]|uniref:Uncharacterized protein n=1 Tax=Hemibagrus wyckioides TaxID=337641 RepID=A0A9D3NT77_9TELE|nr:hypothetical protein KOW79_009893 [Hemibagrus wyckioides]
MTLPGWTELLREFGQRLRFGLLLQICKAPDHTPAKRELPATEENLQEFWKYRILWLLIAISLTTQSCEYRREFPTFMCGKVESNLQKDVFFE